MDDRIVFRYFTVGTGISNADRHAINKDSTLFINKNQLDQVDVGGNWPDYKSFNTRYATNMRFYRTGTRTATSKNPQVFATGTTVGLYTATAGVPITTNNGNVTAARAILVYYAGTNMYYA